MTTTLTRPPDTLTAVVIPAQPDGAGRCWRRLITAIDPAWKGAFALRGRFLNPGTAYEVPTGALIVTCDMYADHRVVRLLRAETGDLAEVKSWDLKTALGKRVVDYAARRLAPDAAGYQATALEALPNRWNGYCAHCHNPVPARTGIVTPVSGRQRVTHRPGQCQTPAVRRNRWGGCCVDCGGWTRPRAGVLRPEAGPLPGQSGWRVVHDGPCPAEPEPAPIRPNRFAGWCRDCGELVEARAGRYALGRRHLEGRCPPAAPYPTWRVYRRPWEPDLEPGQVFLARVTHRPGLTPAVPADAPALRVLAEDWVEFAAEVLETVLLGDGTQVVRVKAATWPGAEEILAAQMRAMAQILPQPGGLRGLFTAEKIGPRYPGAMMGRLFQPDFSRPWLAEITGRDRRFGYQRRFLRPREDWRTATDSKGKRGVRFGWTLKANRVYQAQYPTGYSSAERVYLMTTADGDVREIGRDLVEACLNEMPALLAAFGDEGSD